MTTERTPQFFRLLLDYDFNSPSDSEGNYRCLLPDFLRSVPEVGSEIIFGDRDDHTLTRGVVRRVVQIVHVERTSEIGSEQ